MLAAPNSYASVSADRTKYLAAASAGFTFSTVSVS